MGNGREFVDKNDAQIQKYLDKSVVGLHFYQDIWKTDIKTAFLAKFRQFSQFYTNFIEISIIFKEYYVEKSIILEYIYVEKSIIFE